MAFLPAASTTTIAGAAGSCTLTYRISTPTGLAADAPTVVFLSGLPGDTLWIDKYSYTGGSVSFGSGTYTLSGGTYNTAAQGYILANNLYNAGYRIIEFSYDPLLPPITGICAYGNTRGADPDLAFINAYGYAKAAMNFLLSGISVSNRFAVGHSWGAMCLGMFELPSFYFQMTRSVLMAPVGMDLWSIANTEHNDATALCAVDSATCEYFGGAVGFFKYGGGDSIASDNYNRQGTGNFNVFASASEIFHGTGASTNIRDEMRLTPSIANKLIANSYPALATADGVNDLSSACANMLVMGGTQDYCYNVIADYQTYREALRGIGASLYSVSGGQHSFNGWGATPITAAQNFIQTGSI